MRVPRLSWASAAKVWASFQKPPNFAAAGAVYISGKVHMEGGLLDIHNATAGRAGGLRRGTSLASGVRCERAVKERTAEDRTGEAGDSVSVFTGKLELSCFAVAVNITPLFFGILDPLRFYLQVTCLKQKRAPRLKALGDPAIWCLAQCRSGEAEVLCLLITSTSLRLAGLATQNDLLLPHNFFCLAELRSPFERESWRIPLFSVFLTSGCGFGIRGLAPATLSVRRPRAGALMAAEVFLEGGRMSIRRASAGALGGHQGQAGPGPVATISPMPGGVLTVNGFVCNGGELVLEDCVAANGGGPAHCLVVFQEPAALQLDSSSANLAWGVATANAPVAQIP